MPVTFKPMLQIEYERQLSDREYWRRVLRGEHGKVAARKRKLYEEFAARPVTMATARAALR